MFPDKIWGVMQPAQDMPSGQYTQNDSAGGSTGTVRMPTAVYEMGAHWRHLANTD